MEKKGRYEFVNILRFLAVVLVLNSHYEKLYPISALATGGALGNALFFITSGFLLAHIKQSFPKWYGRRLLRIFIPTWIATLIGYAVNRHWPSDALGWVKQLIWPTGFWFIGALILFYPFYYLVVKKDVTRHFARISIILVIVYFLYYFLFLDTSKWVVEASGITSLEGIFKLIYYFFIMILGAQFRLKQLNYHKIKTGSCVVFSILSVIVMYATKFLMQKIPMTMHFQFINQFCTIAFAVFLMAACLKNEDKIQQWSRKKLYIIISFVSGLTLECYLMQFIVIDNIARLNIIFPVNIIVVTLAVLACAKVLNVITRPVLKHI